MIQKCLKCKKDYDTMNYKNVYCDKCYNEMLSEGIKRLNIT